MYEANDGGGGQSLTGKCCSCANGSYSYSLSGTCSKCTATSKVVDATPECLDSKKSDIQACLKKCGQTLRTNGEFFHHLIEIFCFQPILKYYHFMVTTNLLQVLYTIPIFLERRKINQKPSLCL